VRFFPAQLQKRKHHGAFFTNFHIKYADQDKLIDGLRNIIKARAYVSKPDNGWITCYDELSDRQNTDELNRIAEQLSEIFTTYVFTFLVHDSDIFYFALYDNGNLIDEFNSYPDYFDGIARSKTTEEEKLQLAGKPGVIVRYCKKGVTIEEIKSLLESDYTFAEDVAIQFAEMLGINIGANIGFNYYERDYCDDDSMKLIEHPEYGNRKKIFDEIVNFLITTFFKPFLLHYKDDKFKLKLKNSDDIGNFLINRYKIDIDYSTIENKLIIATIFKEESKMYEFIKSGININETDSWNRTALIWAVLVGLNRTVNILIDSGADLNIKDKYGYTALQYAKIFDHKTQIFLLEHAGSKD
jgi:hypothetical protein